MPKVKVNRESNIRPTNGIKFDELFLLYWQEEPILVNSDVISGVAAREVGLMSAVCIGKICDSRSVLELCYPLAL